MRPKCDSKSANYDQNTGIPEPVTLPVATRAWCVRDPQKQLASSSAPRSRRWKSPPRPEKFIALHTECVTASTASMPGFEGERRAAAGQSLLIGSAIIGRTSDGRIDRELIFYPDDLPEIGVARLRQYIAERTYACGAPPQENGEAQPYRIWRKEARLGTPINGRSVKVQLLPLSEFLKLFYRIACEDRAMVIGYNIPRLLTRLASDWREIKKGKHIGGWRLYLWTYRDPNTGKRLPSAGWRPSIICKRIAPDVIFTEFAGRRGSRYRGEFPDLANLARTLTGRRWALGEALSAFIGEVIDERRDCGRIALDDIAHCRRVAHGIVGLAKALIGLFDRLHPVSRGCPGGFVSETRLFSPGGLARPYLTAAGFSPPAVPEDRLGACAAASHGGWSGVQYAATNFRLCYSIINASIK